MTAEAAPAGPLCDICGAEEAIGSLMQLANYDTTKFGPQCASPYLRSVADAIDGVEAPPEAEEAGPPDEEGNTEYGQDDAEQLAAQLAAGDQATAPTRPDPLTGNVVRSTHGHRRPKGAPAVPPRPPEGDSA